MNNKFVHKKSLGQHFLNSDVVPKLMCDAVEMRPDEVVVEIGPGTGVLTREILNRGARVIAVETDRRAIASLEQTFAEAIARQQLTIVNADARKLDLSEIGLRPLQYKVIANIPYYISGLLFRTFLDSNCQPTDLVFLVQKELAERIARDQKESLLSLSIKAFGQPKYIKTIKRGHFTPPPKVDSAIITVSNINQEFFKQLDKDLFFKAIRAGFGNKRKQLAPNLKSLFPVEQVKRELIAIEKSPLIRAEDLSLPEWHSLLSRLSPTT